jgi:L-iditol 2-dehydrogenase
MILKLGFEAKREEHTGVKVLRLHGVGDLQIHQEAMPVPMDGEVLLRVRAVGVCGSDVHWFNEACIGEEKVVSPGVLGHEFAGEVEGSDRLVAVDPAINCRACEYCGAGNPNFCSELSFAGNPGQDGAFREFLTWPEYLCHPLPESFIAEDGAMLEPLGVALHAFDLAHAFPGMKIAIIGCGPIGLFLIQLARLTGASQILATDHHDHRLDAAQEMGATDVIRTSGGAEVGEILARTGRDGVDLAIEAAGENDAVEVAIEVARPGSRVVLIGIPSEDRTSFRSSVARRNGLTIKLVRRMKHTYPRAIELVEKGLIDVRSLVTHRFPLERYSEAFEIASKQEGLKVIIEP